MLPKTTLVGLEAKYDGPFIFRYLLWVYAGCVALLTVAALIALSLGKLGNAGVVLPFSLPNVALLLGQAVILVGLGWLAVRYSKANYVATVEWNDQELVLHTIAGKANRFSWCEVISHDLPTIEVSARTRTSLQLRIFSAGQQSYYHVPCSWSCDCKSFIDILKQKCAIK